MNKERESARDYIRFLLEEPNYPAAILNPDGEVFRANNRFREYFGEDQFGNIKDLTNDESSRLWDEKLKISIEKGYCTFSIDIKLQKTKACLLQVRFIFSERLGKVISNFTIQSPLQKGKELRSLNVFRKSTNLMIIFDSRGVIEDVNELTYEFFDLPRDYFVGKSYEEIILLLSVTSAKSEVYVRKVFKKGYAEVLQRYELSPNDIRYYQITTFLDKDSGKYITRMADHTEMVIMEQQLSYKEPLAEVGQLAASIAHEIRNPMTTLKGFTQLLRVSASEESSKYLDVIDDEIGRMEAILSEMLVLSKPSTKEKTLVSLDKILVDMIKIVHPKARLEGISFVQNETRFPEVIIYGDETKIKQVLLNLLKNALESMTSGGIITVGLEVVEDDQIHLHITDTGKGMTATQLNQIFMPYFTTRSEGTGLGLPFVIKIIENHGGTISVSSKVGAGSKFTLSFPPPISQVKSEVLEERELLKIGMLR